MRKEIITAVIAGIVVGLAIAFGAWRANSAIKVKQDDNTPLSSANKESAKTQNTQDKLAISLLHFEDYDVLTESPVKITGITKPGSIVVISGENEDYALEARSDGTFEQDVDLTGGVNQILFSVLSRTGEKVNKKVTVVYSSEFSKNISQ